METLFKSKKKRNICFYDRPCQSLQKLLTLQFSFCQRTPAIPRRGDIPLHIEGSTMKRGWGFSVKYWGGAVHD